MLNVEISCRTISVTRNRLDVRREGQRDKKICCGREKEKREVLYVKVLNEEIIYKEEENNYVKYGIL